MNEMLLLILIALTVATAGYGAAQLLLGGAGDRRRMRRRLSRHDAGNATLAQQSILLDRERKGLAARPMFTRLHRHLGVAYGKRSVEMFLTQSVGLGLVLGGVVGVMSMSPLVGAVGFGLGTTVPFMALEQRKSRRQRAMASQLPAALDFLSRILRAGHSLSSGLQVMAEELPQPLAGEFGRIFEQHNLGQPIEAGLREAAERVESTDFSFFVTAVLVQRQTGGDLAEVLDNISGMIRERIRLQEHVKARTAEGRLTGYIMVAFPVVMFLISNALNPKYAGVMTRTSTGLMMLGVAGTCLALGMLMIRRITAVKV